jgi:G3E family GTPase
VAALEALVERQRDFDYILLETTGVADPGNIAPMFWMDEGLGSSIYLDGIVTVADAKNILKSLDEPTPEELPEAEVEASKAEAASYASSDEHHGRHSSPLLTTAHLQISHADVIILNKTDLVSDSELSRVRARISSINSLARLITTNHAQIDSLSGVVLDLNAYSTFPGFGPSSAFGPAMPDFTSKGHSHLDPTISTVTVPLPAFDPQKLPLLEGWLETLLWDAEDSQQGQPRKYEIHRTKGLIPVLDGTFRVVQGVREIFEIIEVPRATEDDGSTSEGMQEGKLVFIGRNLDLLDQAGADLPAV